MVRKQHPLALLSLIVLVSFPLASVGGQSADAKYQEGRQAYKAEKYGQAMQILKPLAESSEPCSRACLMVAATRCMSQGAPCA